MEIRRPQSPTVAPNNHQEVAKESSTTSTSKSISHGIAEAKDSFESAKSQEQDLLSKILNLPAAAIIVLGTIESQQKEEGAAAKEKESGSVGPAQNNPLTDQAAQKPFPSASYDARTITQSPFKKKDD
jgi:hypothetical protein